MCKRFFGGFCKQITVENASTLRNLINLLIIQSKVTIKRRRINTRKKEFKKIVTQHFAAFDEIFCKYRLEDTSPFNENIYSRVCVNIVSNNIFLFTLKNVNK